MPATELLYDDIYNEETDDYSENIIGASIDLRTLHEDLGYIPHPAELCNNPDPQQEIWISLSKNLEDKKLTTIPHILYWTGTNIGFYDAEEFNSTAEDDEISLDDDRFFVWWQDEMQ